MITARTRRTSVRVLITGITGFAGRHLAEHLRSREDLQLHGLARRPVDVDHVQVHPVDLLDPEAVRAVLWLIQPHQIYHLAAYTDAGRSFRESRRVWEANLTATLNLYDACLSELSDNPRILYVSTGAVYGEVGEPITEHSALQPNSPYAASKAAADLASFQYWASERLPIIRVRPFNQVGPGQSTNFALARFAEQIVHMERRELEPVLRVGNLDAERDFTDIRDMVRAYALVMDRGTPGDVYNAASGTSEPMRWYLDRLLEHTRLSITVETDPRLLRPVETQHLRVDIAKLHQTTTWAPQILLAQTLHDLIWETRRALPHA
jgi:GDP-4-dehydro-6-deoxy-D-mannose reductase